MPLASFVVQPEVFARFPGLAVVGAEVDGGTADGVLADLAEGLRVHFGAEPRTFVVEEAAPVADWPA